LQKRLADLNSGRDVLVYVHEIPAHMLPAREDGQIAFTLSGDTLVTVPAQYQRAVASLPVGELG